MIQLSAIQLGVLLLGRVSFSGNGLIDPVKGYQRCQSGGFVVPAGSFSDFVLGGYRLLCHGDSRFCQRFYGAVAFDSVCIFLESQSSRFIRAKYSEDHAAQKDSPCEDENSSDDPYPERHAAALG